MNIEELKKCAVAGDAEAQFNFFFGGGKLLVWLRC